jgi:4-hydroxy-tetrahydrodipicolinate synthase
MARLGAILTAMVTPFDADLRVDDDGVVALARHLADHGSDGLVVCGTTGEASTLTDDEHLHVVELVVEAVRDRETTVIAGTGSNDTRHAIELTERAAGLGVDAVLSVTPYYNKPNPRGLLAHFRAIADASACDVLLYNIPSRCAVDMPNDLLAELAEHERIVGVKQANNDNLALIDGLDLYAGNDDTFCDVLELGGAGGILVASQIVGEEMRRMVDEPENRRAIDAKLRPVYEALTVTGNPIPIKAALNLLGLPAGGLRLPLVEASEEEIAVVRTALEQHGLLRPVAS